jgi:hypothetical protein
MPLMHAGSEAYARYAREFREEDSALVRRVGVRF